MYNFSCHLTCKHCQTSLWVFIITHFQLVIAKLMENDFKSKCFHCSVLRLNLSNRKKNTVFSFCSISSIPERDGELKSTGKYLAIHIFIYWDNCSPADVNSFDFRGKTYTTLKAGGHHRPGKGEPWPPAWRQGEPSYQQLNVLLRVLLGDDGRPLTD